jgi:adenylate kinase
MYDLDNVAYQSTSDGEEFDFEGLRSDLNELKEQLRLNNGKLPAAQQLDLVRGKLRSMPCRNQGYVLDGYPTTNDEANDLLRPIDDEGSREERTIPVVDEQISPEFVFTLEMSDSAIRHRFMKMPDGQSKYTEDSLTKKLDEFRKQNTDEVTVLNFFDELEVTPFTLQVEILDTSRIMKHVVDQVGAIRNYGPSPDQIQQQLLKEEEQRRLHETLLMQEVSKRETEEHDRFKKIQKEWVIGI